MHIYTFFVILIVGFTLTITAIIKPEIIKEKYAQVKAPYDQYWQQKENEKWKLAKDQQRAEWMLQARLPIACNSAQSALKALECRNEKDQELQKFEQQWQYKIAHGWQPS